MPCRPCVNMAVREKVREKYGIEGSTTMDGLFHCCVPVCAIAQEANEVQQNGHAPPGTIILSLESRRHWGSVRRKIVSMTTC